jgi:hypothetical protein
MAERNFYLERLTHENCAMVLIDQQTGTMLGVQDFAWTISAAMSSELLAQRNCISFQRC